MFRSVRLFAERRRDGVNYGCVVFEDTADVATFFRCRFIEVLRAWYGLFVRILEKVVHPSVLGDGAGPLVSASVRFKNIHEEAGQIRKIVTAGIANMAIRELAVSIIVPDVEMKNEYAQALAIGQWVQDNIYYVHEGVETFERPETTLRLKSGDCDAMTVLILSLCGAIGIRGKMCILKLNGRYAHIFPVVFVKVPARAGKKAEMHRLTLDATLDFPLDALKNPIEMCQARGDKVETIFA